MFRCDGKQVGRWVLVNNGYRLLFDRSSHAKSATVCLVKSIEILLFASFVKKTEIETSNTHLARQDLDNR